MHHHISLESFLSKLSLKSDIKPEELEDIVLDLFAHVRINTEHGSWVEIEGFGSFHPLWYEIKKHKEHKKTTLAKYLLLGIAFLAIIFLFFTLKDDVIPVSKNKQETLNEVPKQQYNCFTSVEQNQTETTEKFYDYTVVKGDNLYTISKLLYGDSKYWPLIFENNINEVNDMDSIYPNNVLKIPRISQDSSAQKELAIVYIQAYKVYKRLSRDNKAHWLLYWGRQNIDSDLLDTFIEDIESEDSEIVKEYIRRFGDKQ